jgi:uncharacterized protein YqjF (DUF2071 family)
MLRSASSIIRNQENDARGLPAPIVALQDFGEGLLRPASGLSPTFRQADLLSSADHRPWPLPKTPWFMRQTWSDLLFAHWAVPVQRLSAVLPAELPIDTYDGSAWIGTTPFLVTGLRLRGTVPVPVVSRFPELNVRTYVTVDGKPGIYFLSLDAARRSAVFAARRSYRLPYFHARMRRHKSGGEVEFSSERVSTDGPGASFSATYGPMGPASTAAYGSLEYFLTERYCLYTLDEDKRIQRGEIHHPPWLLQQAVGSLQRNTMTEAFGIQLKGEPLLHFARRQDVLLWLIEPA